MPPYSCLFTYIHTHIDTYVYIYACMCEYTYLIIYIYVYIHTCMEYYFNYKVHVVSIVWFNEVHYGLMQCNIHCHELEHMIVMFAKSLHMQCNIHCYHLVHMIAMFAKSIMVFLLCSSNSWKVKCVFMSCSLSREQVRLYVLRLYVLFPHKCHMSMSLCHKSCVRHMTSCVCMSCSLSLCLSRPLSSFHTHTLTHTHTHARTRTPWHPHARTYTHTLTLTLTLTRTHQLMHDCVGCV